jgi:hypothetical protein
MQRHSSPIPKRIRLMTESWPLGTRDESPLVEDAFFTSFSPLETLGATLTRVGMLGGACESILQMIDTSEPRMQSRSDFSFLSESAAAAVNFESDRRPLASRYLGKWHVYDAMQAVEHPRASDEAGVTVSAARGPRCLYFL